MKVIATTAGLAAMVMSLALPALLLAQEPAPEPVPAEPAPAEPVPETPPPAEETPAEQPVPPENVPPAGEAAAPESAALVAKGSASVSMVDYAFSPATVTINLGDTVTWSNTGEEDHDAAGSGFSTGTVTPGGSGSATFSSAGSFAYVCTFHPDMKGTVVVNDPSDGGTAPKGDDGTVDPATGAPLTEAAAGTAAGAAGSSDALPASGEEEVPLLLLGAGLLGCGALAAALARWRSREASLPLHLA